MAVGTARRCYRNSVWKMNSGNAVIEKKWASIDRYELFGAAEFFGTCLSDELGGSGPAFHRSRRLDLLIDQPTEAPHVGNQLPDCAS